MTIILLIAALVLLAVDWLQTITICRTGRREVWIEKIIGRYPKEHRVHLWFGFCAFVLVALSPVVPAWVFGVCAVGELAAVVRNFRLGIRPASPWSL